MLLIGALLAGCGASTPSTGAPPSPPAPSAPAAKPAGDWAPAKTVKYGGSSVEGVTVDHCWDVTPAQPSAPAVKKMTLTQFSVSFNGAVRRTLDIDYTLEKNDGGGSYPLDHYSDDDFPAGGLNVAKVELDAGKKEVPILMTEQSGQMWILKITNLDLGGYRCTLDKVQ